MKFRSVTFNVTSACNLACRYCYGGLGGEPPQQTLSFESAIAFLRLYADPFQYGNLPPAIGFMGGEPTMAMDTVIRVAERCRSTYRCGKFSMTTNGTRFMVPLASCVGFECKIPGITIGRALDRLGFDLTLSLDGPAKAHDEQRVKRNGEGSFRDVMKSLEYLSLAAPDMLSRSGFRATYCPGTQVPIVERLRFFNGLISLGWGRSVHIEAASMEESGCRIADPKAVFDFGLLEEEYSDAADWYVSEVRSGKSPDWGDVVRKFVFPILNKKERKTCCGAGSRYITCGVDGKPYACHRTFGAAFDRTWADNSTASRVGCSECDIAGVCGGGCRAVSVAAGLPASVPSPADCAVRRIRHRTALKIIAALPQSDLERICPPPKPGGRNALQKPVGKDTFRTKRNVFHNGGQLK